MSLARWGTWALLAMSLAVVGLAFIASQRPWRVDDVDRTFASNVVLILLPTVLAGASVSRRGAAVLIGLALWAFLGQRHPGGLRLTLPCTILPALGLFIVLRINYPSTPMTLAVFALSAVTLARAIQLSESKYGAVVALVDGLGIFLAASLILWTVGVSGIKERTAGLDNSLTGGSRVIFPLSTSLATTPAVAALYIVASVPILIGIRRHRLFRLIGVACAFTITVLSDSRMSLVAAVLLGMLILLSPTLFRSAAVWIMAISLITPFVYPQIKAAVAWSTMLASQYIPWVIRRNEDIGTLNAREQIWDRLLWFYQHRVGWVEQIVGFGSNGQVASGASSYYGYGASGFSNDRRLLTAHNSILQTLLDGGWIGAVALAGTMLFMAWKLSQRSSSSHFVALSILVALTIVGTTEVSLSASQAQLTYWVLIGLAFITFAKDESVDTNRLSAVHIERQRNYQ